MKLFLLKFIHERQHPHEYIASFLVRAEDEKSARAIAGSKASTEGAEAWQNTLVTSCEPLAQDGQAGVLLAEYIA